MAETTRLSVGQALDKLRDTGPRKTRLAQVDEKMEALEQDIQRVRAERRRVERDQKRGGSDPAV